MGIQLYALCTAACVVLQPQWYAGYCICNHRDLMLGLRVGWMDGSMDGWIDGTLQPHRTTGYYLCNHRDLITSSPSTYILLPCMYTYTVGSRDYYTYYHTTLQPHLYAGYYLRNHRDLMLWYLLHLPDPEVSIQTTTPDSSKTVDYQHTVHRTLHVHCTA